MLWGTLLLCAALLALPGEGVRAVVTRLVPAHGASLWSWLNALTAALALVVWLLLALLFAWNRRAARGDAA